MTGPWLDALGGTAGYKRGFTTVDYETEAQHQQLGATLRRSPEFGAELPDDLQTDRPSSPFQYVRQFIEKETVWATNTQLMSQALVPQQPKVSHLSSSHANTPHIDLCRVCREE